MTNNFLHIAGIAVLLIAVQSVCAQSDLSSDDLSNQPLYGAVSVQEILPSKDTVVTTFGYGDWWFGAFAGPNLQSYFGDLNLALSQSSSSRNRPQTFQSGSGEGYFFGGLVEWKPPHQKWGLGLGLSFIDVRDGSFEAAPINTRQATFEGETAINYLTLSPSGRLDVLLDGMYAFAGLDFEIRASSEAFLIPTIDTSAVIQEKRKVEFEANGLRVGAHIGAAYEFLLFEFSNEARVRMAPFVSLHYGSEVSGSLGSDLTMGFARAGISVKLSFNNKRQRLRRYDPTQLEPPVVIASLPRSFDFDVPAIEAGERLAVRQLEYIPRQITEEVAVTPELEQVDIQIPKPERPRVQIAAVNSDRILNVVGGPFSTNLDKEATNYLDAVANYLNENPSTEVQIVGYTDNFGTPEETQRVSEARARQVVDYLLKKGIPRGRLLASGLGSRSPIASNFTEAGRRRNRRVTITLIE